MANLYGPKIITDGLILCLDAGNTKSYTGSGTTWTDLAGTKNGTLNNGVSYSNKNKGCLRFDGDNDYISLPLVSSANNSITISCWFRTFNINQAGQMIFYNGSDGSGNGYGIAVNNEGTSDGKILFLYGAVTWIDTGFQTANNTWYNAVMVIESNRSNKLYINGKLVFSGGAYNINTPTIHTEIGRNDYASLRYFNGEIAQALMYNRVLSSTEILQNYNALKSRFAGSTLFDPYFDNVSLLLHFNGINNSTSFIDSSINSLSPTILGDPERVYISTTQSKFGGSSLRTVSNNDTLYGALRYQHEDIAFGTSDFTVEMWFYCPSGGSFGMIWDSNSSDCAGDGFLLFIGDPAGTIGFRYVGCLGPIFSYQSFSLDEWHHVAVSRRAGVLITFLDGVEFGFRPYSVGLTNNTATIGGISQFGPTWAFFDGYIDEVRVTKGVARYTSNFAPPTAEFLNIS